MKREEKQRRKISKEITPGQRYDLSIGYWLYIMCCGI